MLPLDMFKLGLHQGPREAWGMETPLLRNGEVTGRSIPGYILEAQYRCATGYLFVTSWDCGDDSLTVVLANDELRVVDEKSIGAMYDCTLLQGHEVVSQHQLLLRIYCDADWFIRVTVGEALVLHSTNDLVHFVPYPRETLLESLPAKDKARTKPWWRIW